MASLEELYNQGLAQGVKSPEQQQADIDARVAASMPAMLRQFQNQSQGIRENAYGRGMGGGPVPLDFGFGNNQTQQGLGVSTWLAQQLAPLQAQQTEAADRIRQQATNDVSAAQNSAMGNLAANFQRQAQLQAVAMNNAGAAQRQAAASRHADSRAKTANIVGGLTGLGGGVGRIGANMVTQRPGDAGSGSTVWNNVKGIFGGGAPDAQAPGMPGAVDPSTYMPASGGTFGGGSYGGSSFPGGLSLSGLGGGDTFNPQDFAGAFGSMDPYSFNIPQVDNSALWGQFNYGD